MARRFALYVDTATLFIVIAVVVGYFGHSLTLSSDGTFSIERACALLAGVVVATGLVRLATPTWLVNWPESRRVALNWGVAGAFVVASAVASLLFSQGGLRFGLALCCVGATGFVGLILFHADLSIELGPTPLQVAMAGRRPLSDDEFIELFSTGDALNRDILLGARECLYEAVGDDLRCLRPDDPIRDLYYNPKSGEGIPSDVAFRLKVRFGCRFTADEMMNPELTLPMLVNLIAEQKSRQARY
jgi:hypothetical protein